MALRKKVLALVLAGIVQNVFAAEMEMDLEEPQSTQEALMEVTVNSTRQASWTLTKIGRDGDAWVKRSDLQSWGVRLSEGSPLLALAPDAYIRLNSVPGVFAKVDKATSKLAVEVQPSLLNRHDFHAIPTGQPPTPSPLAAFMNYDLQGYQANGPAAIRASTETGMVYDNTVTRSAFLTTKSGDHTWNLRLDSNLTADFPSNKTSVQLGDTFVKLGNNNDALRVAGLAWGTDFSITPAFVTVPLPTVSNFIATQGTVDLYVNGGKTQQLNVPGGPFVIAQVPVTTGAGQLTVVTHDLLGRTQTITQSYYIAPQMLAKGLSSWDAEIGTPRESYGMTNSDYAGILAAAGQRYGVSDRITAQWRIEGDGRGAAFSTQALALTPGNGLITAGPYCSMEARHGGCTYDLSYEYDLKRYGYGVDMSYTAHGFAPVAADLRTPPPRWQMLAHAQTVAPRNIGIAVSATARQEASGAHTQILNVSGSKTFANRGHLDLIVSNLYGTSKSSYVALIYTKSIDRENSYSASGYSSNGSLGEEVSLQRNLPIGEGYGYNLRAAHDSATTLQANAQWNGDVVTLSAATQHAGDRSASSADVSGAALWTSGEFALARRLDRGFAVIQIGDLANVPIYVNGQRLTRTDATGVAVLPDLQPFVLNKVAIDPTSLPMSLDIPETRFGVTTFRRGGVFIDIPVLLAATVHLRMPDGSVVPAGAHVRTLRGMTPVGTEGLAYLEGKEGDNALEVEWTGGQCLTHLKLPAVLVPGGDDTVELLCTVQ